MMTIKPYKPAFVWLALFAAILMIVTSASAGTYVSPKGKFHITYPATWKQLDYTTVDAFLQMHQAGESVLDYDAAFADSSVIPFFFGSYMILTVDSTGPLSNKQIDSVLEGMRKTFGKDIRYFPVADLNAHQNTNSPSYDSAQKIITVLSDVVQDDKIIKKHAFLMKFYDNGIANFFFYAPDSVFETVLPMFEQITRSLSTENLEAATPKAEVKVADIDNREIPKNDEESTGRRSLPFIGGGLFAVIIIVIIKMRRKRSEQARK